MENSLIVRLWARLPWNVLIPLLFIVAIGILNLSSAAQSTRPYLYLSQLSKFSMALFLCLLTATIHPFLVRKFALLGYMGVVFLLFLVLLIGTTAKGGQRWLVFGSFRMQPSDPAKILLILAIADYCAKYWPKDGFSLTSLIRPLNISRPLFLLFGVALLLIRERHAAKFLSYEFLISKTGIILMISLLIIGFSWLLMSLYNLKINDINLSLLIAPIDLPLLLFLLVVVEPDLATGLLLLGIAGLMFLFVGIRKSAIFFSLLMVLFAGVGGYFTLLKDYQRDRLESFLNPEADIQGKGYQAVQSIIAIGSGKFLGKGFMEGTQTQLSFLPENATDFVFSVWGEEWGFVASVLLLILYIFLLKGILRVGSKAEDHFSRLVCVGVASNIFLHVMINVGMVTGILPVAGVPLVLLSYGGSAMITTMIGIGLVINAAIYRGVK